MKMFKKDAAITPTAPAPSSKGGKDDEEAESRAFSHWTSAVLLGPLVPTMFAMFLMFFSQIVLLATPSCSGEKPNSPMEATNSPACTFLKLTIATSYLQVIIYMWVFLGTTVSTHLPFPPYKKIVLLKPFTRLRTLVILYSTNFTFSVVAFLAGLAYLVDSAAIAKDDASLVGYCVFIEIFYWLMAVMLIIMGLRVKFSKSNKGGGGASKSKQTSKGGKSKDGSADSAATPNDEDGGLAWFTHNFQSFAEAGGASMEAEKFAEFIRRLGLAVNADAVATAAVDKLDTEGSGEIELDAAWKWFSEGGGRELVLGKVSGTTDRKTK